VSGEGWTLLASLQRTVEQAKTTSERQEDRRVEAANQVWNGTRLGRSG
jgi:hypothetical protein